MNKIEMEKDFNVMGISIRTTNKAAIEERSIYHLWKKFFEESIISTIPNKIDNAIVAVYYDYENDREGEYSLLIGAKVSNFNDVPEGLTVYHVPSQKRAIFFPESGAPERIVFELWKKVWMLEDEDKLARSYNADYELYAPLNQNPQNMQISLHIGII